VAAEVVFWPEVRCGIRIIRLDGGVRDRWPLWTGNPFEVCRELGAFYLKLCASAVKSVSTASDVLPARFPTPKRSAVNRCSAGPV
jgi:hypothetical protein